MEFVTIFADPKGTHKYTDRYVASVKFTEVELLSFGVARDADDLDPNSGYIEKNEYHKLMLLWRDPLFLSNFFQGHLSYFNDDYWEGVEEDAFVNDILASSPNIFKQIESSFYNNTIDDLFYPLDKSDENKIEYTTCRVKSYFGKIQKRIAFRVYAIKIDDGSYLITGGALKITKKMEQADNTLIELKKINSVYSKLVGEDVTDQASFVEFIFE